MESFGKSMIFTVFAKAKEEISSSKTCIYDHNLPSKSTIDDQMSEMLSLSCTAMNLMTETVNFSASKKSTSIFSITRCQRMMHSSTLHIERCPRLWLMNRIQQRKDTQRNSPYLVQLKFKIQLKSEDRAIRKNTTSCKQHLKSRAQRQNIHGQRNYKPRLLGLQLSRSTGILGGKDQRN